MSLTFSFSAPHLRRSYQPKHPFPSLNTPCLTLPLQLPKLSFPFPFLCTNSLLCSRVHSSPAQTFIQTTNNISDPVFPATAIVIHARNRIGILQLITCVFKLLALRVEKATVEFDGEYFTKTFYVTDSHGNRIEDQADLDKIKKVLADAIDEVEVVPHGDSRGRGKGVAVRRKSSELGLGGRVERMLGLMDGFLKNDTFSLQKDILEHVEYTVARSRFSFDDFEAYQALAHSVRDRLIERWHDTQLHFKRKDPKRIYFLSLEFLMGIDALE